MLVTYFIAFALSTGGFESASAKINVGIALVVVNIVIIVAALVLGFYKNREREAKEAVIFKLRRQLATEKVKDKAKYDAAWEVLVASDPAAAARVMETARALEATYNMEMPLQGEHVVDIDALMTEAAETEARFHTAARKFIMEVGGEFKQAPLKRETRVREKTQDEYNGDHR